MIRHPAARALGGFGLEALTVVAAYAAYSTIRVLVEGSEARAVDHAFTLVSMEQALGLFHEASIQQAVQSQPWLAAAMKGVYLWVYMPFLILAAAVLYARDREMYRCYRNTFFASAALGLVFFAIVPMAPPRMLPELGFIDPIHATMTTTGAKNEFAAMPSFHFGFTMLAAMGIAHSFGWHRLLTPALALVPSVMLLSIVSTANHFFLDAAVGAAVVLAMWTICVGMPKEPEAEVAPEPAVPAVT